MAGALPNRKLFKWLKMRNMCDPASSALENPQVETAQALQILPNAQLIHRLRAIEIVSDPIRPVRLHHHESISGKCFRVTLLPYNRYAEIPMREPNPCTEPSSS